MKTSEKRNHRDAEAPGVEALIPGKGRITLRCLMLDFTGTLSVDGRLLPGVRARLRKTARRLRIIVATADTFGTVRGALAGLPVELHVIKTGNDKARLVNALGAAHTIAVGNGRNDTAMVRRAKIGVAVVGPEGAAGELIRAADIVVHDVRDALDLATSPLRLAATLRD
jgi:soluble P-type ATPase